MRGEGIQTTWANDSFWKFCWVRWDSRTASKDDFLFRCRSSIREGRCSCHRNALAGTFTVELMGGHPGSATHGSRSHPISSDPFNSPVRQMLQTPLYRGAHRVPEVN